MAVLNKIRSKGVFLIIIIALALFAFILGDLLKQGSFTGANSDVIGVIGDTEIKREQFARQVQNFVQSRQGLSEVQAAEQLWTQEINNALLNKQVDEAGIEVSDEAVRNYIEVMYSQYPQFQDLNGSFSDAKLFEFIEDLKQNDPARYKLWQQDVNEAANKVKQMQFFTLLKSGIVGTNAAGKMDYHLENDSRNFSFVNIPYTSIPDADVTVSKEEIKEYIKAREKQYQTVAQRDIVYAFFEDKASKEDTEEIKRNLEQLINDTQVLNKNSNNEELRVGLRNTPDPIQFANENSDIAGSGDFVEESTLSDSAQALKKIGIDSLHGPYEDNGYLKASRVIARSVVMDSVKNRHILIAYAGAERAAPNVTRSRDEAEKLADSIFANIESNKTNFQKEYDYFKTNTELAKSEDIGWVVKSGNASGFAKGFTDFLFSSDKNTIGVAESTFGFHIISIDDTRAPLKTVKLATVAKKIESSKTTGKQLFNTVQKFEAAVEKGNFDAVAKKYNVTSTPVNALKALDETLPGIGTNRPIVKWAFDEETNLNDIKRFEVAQGYVVAKVTKSSEAGLMSVEEASATVTPILRNKKKAAMIMAKIKSGDLQAIASANGVAVQEAIAVNRKNPALPDAGNEPKVVGTAFGIALNKTSKPVAGEAGVFVVKTTAIENAPDIKNYKGAANEAAMRMANQSSSQLLEALKKNVDIKDNRSKFY